MRLLTPRDQLFLGTARLLVDGYVATASLFNYRQNSEKPEIPFLVTNAHVVREKRSGDIFFLQADSQGRPLLGNPYTFSSTRFDELWHCHPDKTVDIAVAPFDAISEDLDARRVELANRWISMENVFVEHPFRMDVDEHPWVTLFGVNIEAVEEVLFVGYPSGYFDRVNHLPVVRRGITATPLSVDYENERTFLIDAPILPGSSGSPVFIVDSMATRRITGVAGKERFLFVGVVSEFLPFKGTR